jgi:hypothetical protein
MAGHTCGKDDVAGEGMLIGASCLAAGASGSAITGFSDAAGFSTTGGLSTRGGSGGIGISVVERSLSAVPSDARSRADSAICECARSVSVSVRGIR